MKELQRNALSRIAGRLHRIPRLLRAVHGVNREASGATHNSLCKEALLPVPCSLRKLARITAAQRTARAVQNKQVQRLDW